MAGFDLTAAAFILKEHYSGQVVKALTYKKNPFHAMLAKYSKFTGKNHPLPTLYARPQGRSATFSNALAQKQASKGVEFFLTRNHDYCLADIDNETMLATGDDLGAFTEAMTLEIDGAIESCMRSLAIAEYRDGTGAIGNISAGSNVTTATITLANPSDITNFEVGQTIGSSPDMVTENVGSVLIVAINRVTGTLTASAAWDAGITGVAAGDFLFVKGDFNGKIKGLAAWVPDAAPGATAFFGVDRSVDVTRLGGQRLDISALPIEEGVVELASIINREGGSPDVAFMNFQNYANLEKALGAKVMYCDSLSEDAAIAFTGIKIHSQKGWITVLPDLNCPSDHVYMLEMGTWKLYSLGEAPMLLDSDGNRVLRLSSSDAVEARIGYYAQLGCVAPGYNGVGLL